MTNEHLNQEGQAGSLASDAQEENVEIQTRGFDESTLPLSETSSGEIPGNKDSEDRPEIRAIPAGGSALGIEEVPPWPRAVSGSSLLYQLRSVMKRSLVLPQWGAETLALWVLHTYAFELREVTAYLGISSPEKRCGKTTLLEVLSLLVNRPLSAANISPPALFRVIEEARPTLLIDEADTFLGGNEEMRGILNAGYARKLAFVVRVNQTRSAARGARNGVEEDEGKQRRDGSASVGLRRFSCWCPKAIASIGRLPETLMDRCVVIHMQRKRPDEKVQRLKEKDAAVLRQKCARFVRDNAMRIASHQPEIPHGLNDRAADIWEPLLTLADLADASGFQWSDYARTASLNLTAREEVNNPVGALLLDMMMCFMEAKADRRLSREVVRWLKGRQDRPWREARKGKEIDELWLAQQLRPYGVRPRPIWVGNAVGKGYRYEDLDPIFKRYITRSDLETLRAMMWIKEEKQEEKT